MKRILFSVILAVMLMSSVLAYFPDTHYQMTKETLKTTAEGDLYRVCSEYPDHCYSGNILSDVSVIFYFTTFNKYKITHSPSFCRAMLESANDDIELSCAVGACLHQTQDIHSHTELVPNAIIRTLLPNVAIHSLAEQHVENEINDRNPQAHIERLQATDVFEDCTPIFKRVLRTEEAYQDVDLDLIFDKFVVELEQSESGYDPSFENISSIPIKVLAFYISALLLSGTIFFLLLFRRNKSIFNWISLIIILFVFVVLAFVFIANIGGQAFQAFTFVIKPISNLVPIGSSDGFVNNGIERGNTFFAEGGLPSLFDTDSSGEQALANADSQIATGQTILIITLVTILTLFLFFNFRRR